MATTFTAEELQYIMEAARENPNANLDTILAHMAVDMQMVSEETSNVGVHHG